MRMRRRFSRLNRKVGVSLGGMAPESFNTAGVDRDDQVLGAFLILLALATQRSCRQWHKIGTFILLQREIFMPIPACCIKGKFCAESICLAVQQGKPLCQ